jgi:hypothetical protein
MRGLLLLYGARDANAAEGEVDADAECRARVAELGSAVEDEEESGGEERG